MKQKEKEVNGDTLEFMGIIPKKIKEWYANIMKMIEERETYTQYGDRQIKKDKAENPKCMNKVKVQRTVESCNRGGK